MLETELEPLPRLIADTAGRRPDSDDRTFGKLLEQRPGEKAPVTGEEETCQFGL